MSEHTPGDGRWTSATVSGGACPQASFNSGEDEGHFSVANARLISAAPDLLEAALVALSTVRMHVNPDSPTAHILEAAIAKAEGRSE